MRAKAQCAENCQKNIYIMKKNSWWDNFLKVWVTKLAGGRNGWVAFIKLYTEQKKAKTKQQLWKGNIDTVDEISKYSGIRDGIENIGQDINV